MMNPIPSTAVQYVNGEHPLLLQDDSSDSATWESPTSTRNAASENDSNPEYWDDDPGGGNGRRRQRPEIPGIEQDGDHGSDDLVAAGLVMPPVSRAGSDMRLDTLLGFSGNRISNIPGQGQSDSGFGNGTASDVPNSISESASGVEAEEEEAQTRRDNAIEDIDVDAEGETDGDLSEGHGQNGEWEVERIVGERVTQGIIEYLVKWKNFPHGDNTWEPPESFGNSSDMLNAFRRLPVAQRRKRIPDTNLPLNERSRRWHKQHPTFQQSGAVTINDADTDDEEEEEEEDYGNQTTGVRDEDEDDEDYSPTAKWKGKERERSVSFSARESMMGPISMIVNGGKSTNRGQAGSRTATRGKKRRTGRNKKSQVKRTVTSPETSDDEPLAAGSKTRILVPNLQDQSSLVSQRKRTSVPRPETIHAPMDVDISGPALSPASVGSSRGTTVNTVPNVVPKTLKAAQSQPAAPPSGSKSAHKRKSDVALPVPTGNKDRLPPPKKARVEKSKPSPVALERRASTSSIKAKAKATNGRRPSVPTVQKRKASNAVESSEEYSDSSSSSSSESGQSESGNSEGYARSKGKSKSMKPTSRRRSSLATETTKKAKSKAPKTEEKSSKKGKTREKKKKHSKAPEGYTSTAAVGKTKPKTDGMGFLSTNNEALKSLKKTPKVPGAQLDGEFKRANTTFERDHDPRKIRETYVQKRGNVISKQGFEKLAQKEINFDDPKLHEALKRTLQGRDYSVWAPHYREDDQTLCFLMGMLGISIMGGAQGVPKREPIAVGVNRFLHPKHAGDVFAVFVHRSMLTQDRPAKGLSRLPGLVPLIQSGKRIEFMLFGGFEVDQFGQSYVPRPRPILPWGIFVVLSFACFSQPERIHRLIDASQHSLSTILAIHPASCILAQSQISSDPSKMDAYLTLHSTVTERKVHLLRSPLIIANNWIPPSNPKDLFETTPPTSDPTTSAMARTFPQTCDPVQERESLMETLHWIRDGGRSEVSDLEGLREIKELTTWRVGIGEEARRVILAGTADEKSKMQGQLESQGCEFMNIETTICPLQSLIEESLV